MTTEQNQQPSPQKPQIEDSLTSGIQDLTQPQSGDTPIVEVFENMTDEFFEYLYRYFKVTDPLVRDSIHGCLYYGVPYFIDTHKLTVGLAADETDNVLVLTAPMSCQEFISFIRNHFESLKEKVDFSIPSPIYDMQVISEALSEDSSEQDLQSVQEALMDAAAHDLEAEVVLSALKYIRENPTASIEDAMQHGLKEWDI